MTHTSNAKVAGFTFLIYIAAGILLMILSGRATNAAGIAALPGIVQHATEMRVTVLLNVVTSLSAFVLAVSLFAITRQTDPDVAMLGLICRVAEGVVGFGAAGTRGLLWLAAGGAAAGTPDGGASQLLGAYLLKSGAWSGSAMFFSVGSLAFCWLMLRGRIVPVALAWLGVLASALLVICLPLQLAGFLAGPIVSYMWLPMLAFEVPLALWLITKGADQRTADAWRMRSHGSRPTG